MSNLISQGNLFGSVNTQTQGNYLTAEILYRAKISPHKTLEEIYNDDALIKRLTKNIKYVLKLCFLTNKTGYMNHIEEHVKQIRKNIKSGKIKDYHKTVKIKDEEFCYYVYRKKTDPFDNKVIAEEIIKNRRMYWVPTVQK